MDTLVSLGVFIIALFSIWVLESFAAFLKKETNLMDDKVTAHLVNVGLLFIAFIVLFFSCATGEAMVFVVIGLHTFNRLLMIENYGLTIPIPQKYNFIYFIRKHAFNK